MFCTALRDPQNPPLSLVLHSVTPEQSIVAQALGSGATLFTIFPTPSSSAASVHNMVASGSTLQHLIVVSALSTTSDVVRLNSRGKNKLT